MDTKAKELKILFSVFLIITGIFFLIFIGISISNIANTYLLPVEDQIEIEKHSPSQIVLKREISEDMYALISINAIDLYKEDTKVFSKYENREYTTYTLYKQGEEVDASMYEASIELTTTIDEMIIKERVAYYGEGDDDNWFVYSKETILLEYYSWQEREHYASIKEVNDIDCYAYMIRTFYNK